MKSETTLLPQQQNTNRLLKYILYFLIIALVVSHVWITTTAAGIKTDPTVTTSKAFKVVGINDRATTAIVGGDDNNKLQKKDCQSLVEQRRMERKPIFETLFAKFPLDPKQGNFAERNGLLSHDGDTIKPIDCDLYYQQPSEDNRTVYFLHIHKAGGTSFCAAATANYYFADFNNNCNVGVKRCCGGNSIESHQEFVQNTPYKFVANEWPMYDVMDLERYRYVVQLRKSKDRLRSEYYFDIMQKRKRNPKFFIKFHQWLETKPDNFSMRMICGDRCLLRPKFELTREDLRYTLERLQKFDNIVLLEDYERTYSKFASEVGWNTWPGAKNVNTKKYSNNSQPKTTARAPDDEDMITTLDMRYLALDDAIYQFAVSLVNHTFHYGTTTTTTKHQQQGDDSSIISSSTYTFSPDIDKAVEEYFNYVAPEGIKNNTCQTACCNQCTYMFGWGDYLNRLMNGTAT